MPCGPASLPTRRGSRSWTCPWRASLPRRRPRTPGGSAYCSGHRWVHRGLLPLGGWPVPLTGRFACAGRAPRPEGRYGHDEPLSVVLHPAGRPWPVRGGSRGWRLPTGACPLPAGRWLPSASGRGPLAALVPCIRPKGQCSHGAWPLARCSCGDTCDPTMPMMMIGCRHVLQSRRLRCPRRCAPAAWT